MVQRQAGLCHSRCVHMRGLCRSGQQHGIKPDLENTRGTRCGAGTLKRVKFYSRVQEPLCCHLAFLAVTAV